MSNAGPVPVFNQGPNEVEVYSYVAWPAWMYNPADDGKGRIFQHPEDVPEGWLTLDELQAEYEIVIEPDEGEQPELDEDGNVIRKLAIPPLAPSQTPTGVEAPRELTEEQRNALIEKVREGTSQKGLVDALEYMNRTFVQLGKEEIEFFPAWPKQKLAEAIVDNGGPYDDGE